jgi:hypothetical protein
MLNYRRTKVRFGVVEACRFPALAAAGIGGQNRPFLMKAFSDYLLHTPEALTRFVADVVPNSRAGQPPLGY